MWNPFKALAKFLSRVWKVLSDNLTKLWNAIKKPLFIIIIVAIIVLAIMSGAGFLVAGSFLASMGAAFAAYPLVTLGATLFMFYLIDEDTARELVQTAGKLTEDIVSEVADVADEIGEGAGNLVSGFLSAFKVPALIVAGGLGALYLLNQAGSGSGDTTEDEYLIDS